jgi:hypothetical protein
MLEQFCESFYFLLDNSNVLVSLCFDVSIKNLGLPVSVVCGRNTSELAEVCLSFPQRLVKGK